ncbi:hypothetical protein [Streptomyces sp. PSAA01]|uniref:hypothetical protein n=1 Tax=Streptomyces sp. PSAA01 TaxID=2912762 RepID=UPI0027E2B8A1|nr:hypothetical protein [Streptomyces sp. PSAA01]
MTTTASEAASTGEAPFFPAPRTCPFSAPPQHTAFREAGGLHKVTIWDGSTAPSTLCCATRIDDGASGPAVGCAACGRLRAAS